jgi:hypothetical protein
MHKKSLFSLRERMSVGQVRVLGSIEKLAIKKRAGCYHELPHPAFGHLLPEGEEETNNIYEI